MKEGLILELSESINMFRPQACVSVLALPLTRVSRFWILEWWISSSLK